MKSAACPLVFAALVAFVALPVCAQSTSADKPQFAPVPPPPGMNDPGVKPVAPPAHASSAPAETPAEPTPSRYPSKPIPLPAMPGEPATQRPSPPEVSVHQQGDNTVQEYRENGRLYMVVVTPKHGIAQTYMVDPNGKLYDQNGAPPVKPVMYKVMEWGQSKPAEASSSGDSGH